MQAEATERLRVLRLRLTVLFTVMNTLGLVVFGPLIVALDEQIRVGGQEAELRRVTSSVIRLIRTAGDAIDFGLIPADPLYRSCPKFAIVSGDGAFPTYRGQGACGDVADAELQRLTDRAISRGVLVSADATGLTGEPVRVVVEPYAESRGRYTGAVAAWTSLEDDEAAHQRVVLLVLGACVVLVAGVAVAGYWLAGRATRPAAEALKRQEELLADTAHDLRTPVAALRVYAENAARDRETAVEELPKAVRLAARMGDIIDGLLVRARLAAGVEQLSVQPLWLDQLVAAVVEDTPHGDANVSVVTAPTKVLADRVLVERAVGNLLDNALRHGRTPGGRAVVTVTVADGRVIVADQGPGIDPELIGDDDPAVFERFTGSRGSSGLGLTIVRWMAEAHGGTLRVHNSDEGGAIVEFTLPTLDD